MHVQLLLVFKGSVLRATHKPWFLKGRASEKQGRDGKNDARKAISPGLCFKGDRFLKVKTKRRLQGFFVGRATFIAF
jgi:hypothetical protein